MAELMSLFEGILGLLTAAVVVGTILCYILKKAGI